MVGLKEHREREEGIINCVVKKLIYMLFFCTIILHTSKDT